MASPSKEQADALLPQLVALSAEKGVEKELHFKIRDMKAEKIVGNIQNQFIIRQNTPPLLGRERDNTSIDELLESVLNDAARDQVCDRRKSMQLQDVSPRAIFVDFYKDGSENMAQSNNRGESIWPEDFFNSESWHTLAIVGGAGYGKTEMLKRFTLDVLDKRIEHLQEITVVHYMNFHDIEAEDNITPGELLFGETRLAKHKIDQAVAWILLYSQKFLLVLDGADQYLDPEHVLGTGKLVRSPEARSHSTAILNAILSGRLFPGIRVLFSSREHSLRHFLDEVRPNVVVLLMGFELSDIKRLVCTKAGEYALEIWNQLKTISPSLLSLGTIPMFLDFTTAVMLRHMADPLVSGLPDTLTELLMHVLNDWTTSEYIQCQEEIYDVIHQLKAMSFHGTVAGKVVFTKKDLPEGMTEDGYKDLLVPVVGAKGRNRRLKEGHFKFLFIHESLQEALTALYVAEMPYDDFKKLVAGELHTSKWAMVRRILCGVLFNRSALKAAKGTDPSVSLLRIDDDVHEKRELMRKSLLLQIKLKQTECESKEGQLHFLELLHTIHESKDETLASSLRCVDIPLITLTDNDLQVISTVIGSRMDLEYLAIHGLGAARARSFGEKMQKSKIWNLDYGQNSVLSHDEVLSVCEMFSNNTRSIVLNYIAHGEKIKEIGARFCSLPSTVAEIHVYGHQILDARGTGSRPARCRLMRVDALVSRCSGGAGRLYQRSDPTRSTSVR